MKIEINNCQECPFCNQDNEFGPDGCNLDSDLLPDGQGEGWFREMPADRVHDNCPLKKGDVNIKLITTKPKL